MSGRPTQVGAGRRATALVARSATHHHTRLVLRHAGADAADRKTKRIRMVVVGSGYARFCVDYLEY